LVLHRTQLPEEDAEKRYRHALGAALPQQEAALAELSKAPGSLPDQKEHKQVGVTASASSERRYAGGNKRDAAGRVTATARCIAEIAKFRPEKCEIGDVHTFRKKSAPA
jgi:hypothetical protein